MYLHSTVTVTMSIVSTCKQCEEINQNEEKIGGGWDGGLVKVT